MAGASIQMGAAQVENLSDPRYDVSPSTPTIAPLNQGQLRKLISWSDLSMDITEVQRIDHVKRDFKALERRRLRFPPLGGCYVRSTLVGRGISQRFLRVSEAGGIRLV